LVETVGLFSVLDEACWDGATLKLREAEFETGMRKWSEWNHDHGRFFLMKPRVLLKDYARFWRSQPKPRNVMELGIWEGGSAAFWFEFFRPEKHVAIDVIDRIDSEHFLSYVRGRGAADQLKTYWGVNQGDPEALREIVTREFADPLDLVIDDASHVYELTRASFETLFPLLRHGGFYIIEDWRCSYDVHESPLQLVHEILDSFESVYSVTALPGFAAIQKTARRPRTQPPKPD
jgi:Methyltransferase domain